MKAISLQQPWASLVVIGAKKYETRGWATNHRGKILIHASKGKEMGQGIWQLPAFNKFIKDFHSLPFGAIIGEAAITFTVETEAIRKKIIDTDEYQFGDYKTGRSAWKLVNPIAYKNPVPWRGELNVFEVDDQKFFAAQNQINKHKHI